MSILLTGFDPFDGAGVNPSWEAVSRVPDEICRRKVHRLQLPTIYGQAADRLMREIRRLQPELVICCGAAGGRQAVTPELVAINYRCARIADNAGQLYAGDPIDPDGPAAYMTSLPVHAMIGQMKDAGIPAALSFSAGAYVCNDVYYALLAGQSAHGYRGLFIHVPGAEAVDADTAARALTLCMQTALCADALSPET